MTNTWKHIVAWWALSKVYLGILHWYYNQVWTKAKPRIYNANVGVQILQFYNCSMNHFRVENTRNAHNDLLMLKYRKIIIRNHIFLIVLDRYSKRWLASSVVTFLSILNTTKNNYKHVYVLLLVMPSTWVSMSKSNNTSGNFLTFPLCL